MVLLRFVAAVGSATGISVMRSCSACVGLREVVMASVCNGGGSLLAARLSRESEGHGGRTVAACMRKGGWWWLAEEASAVYGRAAAEVDVKFSLLCPCMLRVEVVQVDS